MDIQNNKNKRVVLEKLSHIEFLEYNDNYILHDLLRDLKFDVNKSFCSICQKIDGNKSNTEIATEIAIEFGLSETEAQNAVLYVFKTLIKKNLVFVKGGIKYRLVKCFYFLTGYRY